MNWSPADRCVTTNRTRTLSDVRPADVITSTFLLLQLIKCFHIQPSVLELFI